MMSIAILRVSHLKHVFSPHDVFELSLEFTEKKRRNKFIEGCWFFKFQLTQLYKVTKKKKTGHNNS